MWCTLLFVMCNHFKLPTWSNQREWLLVMMQIILSDNQYLCKCISKLGAASVTETFKTTFFLCRHNLMLWIESSAHGDVVKKLKHCSIAIGCWDIHCSVHLLYTLQWISQHVLNQHAKGQILTRFHAQVATCSSGLVPRRSIIKRIKFPEFAYLTMRFFSSAGLHC